VVGRLRLFGTVSRLCVGRCSCFFLLLWRLGVWGLGLGFRGRRSGRMCRVVVGRL
jgi:hypothetical protein